MSTLNERLAKLPAARRRKVDRRYRELRAEEMRLDELRRSLGLTQAAMARKLHVNQPRVSKIESTPDATLEAMRSYVEALGGRLEVVAVFDKRPHAPRGAQHDKRGGILRRVRIRSSADLKRA